MELKSLADTFAVPGGSEGIGFAGQNTQFVAFFHGNQDLLWAGFMALLLPGYQALGLAAYLVSRCGACDRFTANFSC